jgi:hypothetical protein
LDTLFYQIDPRGHKNLKGLITSNEIESIIIIIIIIKSLPTKNRTGPVGYNTNFLQTLKEELM